MCARVVSWGRRRGGSERRRRRFGTSEGREDKSNSAREFLIRRENENLDISTAL